jgi:4-amino-4-deoxy-L-arabinose transferase-like glycosyltransferase
VAYSLVTPLYEPTDELGHVRFVRHLATYRRLPVQERTTAPLAPTHHPPLYYALGALVSGWVPVEQEVYYEPVRNPFWGYRYWEPGVDNKNQFVPGPAERLPGGDVARTVYLVRWMSVLLGAGAVTLTYAIGRELFPHRRALVAGGTALFALTPQFVHLSASVNNDTPATLFGAAILLMCVRLVRRGPDRRTDVILGVLYGLALLTKFHLLAFLGVITCAYALTAARFRDRRAFVRGVLVVLILATLIAGWWFWRNQVLYGEPTGLLRMTERFDKRTPWEDFASSWQTLLIEIPYAWSSLWGRFGYGQLPLPEGLYRFLIWGTAGGGAGLLVALAARLGTKTRRWTADQWFVLPVLLLTVVTFIVVLLSYILISPAGAMGRFVFPALPAFAFLLMLGLSRLVPRRFTPAVGWVTALGAGALALYALLGVLAPAFTPPRPLSARAQGAIPNATAVEFGDVARLVGYAVAPAEVTPGDVVEVTLYWQALRRTEAEYAVFVHLLSGAGTMVAQRDTYPGLGRFPTTAWEPGTLFADTYRLHVPETTYTPDQAFVQVGLYRPRGPRLVTGDGRDAVRLADVTVRSLPGEYPNPLRANFGDQITLVGYEMDRRVARPGETITLTLYWRAERAELFDYSVFAHVTGTENQIWARDDGWPVEGNAPTRTWEPGRVVTDVRELTLVPVTPPGFHEVEVGLYGGPEGDRLPYLAEDGHWISNRVLLSNIRVVDE